MSQAVPLVPLMEENEDAMETASFQRLLRKLGIRAPADEQVGRACCLRNHQQSANR